MVLTAPTPVTPTHWQLEQVGELAAFVSAYIANTRKVLEQLLEAERSLEEM